MNSFDTAISKALNRDPLHEAEQLTGRSYKDDKLTEDIGFLFHLDRVDQKNALLSIADDTRFCEPTENYLRIVEAEGFRTVLEVPFTDHTRDGCPERFIVMFHDADGILLHFDTYDGRRNSGQFHYNWSPLDREKMPRYITSGGGWEQVKERDGMDLWVGDHDCREAIRFRIRQLREAGRFVTPWVKAPCPFWLCHYRDIEPDKDRDYHVGIGMRDEITVARFAMLPEDVRSRLLLK